MVIWIARLGTAKFPITNFNVRYVRGIRKGPFMVQPTLRLITNQPAWRCELPKNVLVEASCIEIQKNPQHHVPSRIKNKRGLISNDLTNFSASPISNKQPVRSVWSKEKRQIILLHKQGFTADQYSWKPELRNNSRWGSSVELQKNRSTVYALIYWSDTERQT